MKHLNRLLFLCFFSFLTYQAAGQTIVQGQMLTEYCPQYTSSGFSTRLPTFFRARISGLTIGETFYYTVRACSRADIGTTNSGVGGSLYTSLDSPTFYTGSPSFTTGNFDSFTVVSGLESYWFAFVNSTNIRFSAGNYVFPLVTIKSADPASSFSIKLALRDSIKVLAFTTSAGANNGTGVYGTSKAGSKDIVMLFDSNLSSSRPLTIALTENDNFAASLYSAPSFYTNNVDGVVGAWAGILPNTMPKGIRRIDRRDFSSNMLLHSSRDTNGVWFSVNTKNPAGGSTSPIVFTEEEAALLPTDFGFTQPFISVSEDADSF